MWVTIVWDCRGESGLHILDCGPSFLHKRGRQFQMSHIPFQETKIGVQHNMQWEEHKEIMTELVGACLWPNSLPEDWITALWKLEKEVKKALEDKRLFEIYALFTSKWLFPQIQSWQDDLAFSPDYGLFLVVFTVVGQLTPYDGSKDSPRKADVALDLCRSGYSLVKTMIPLGHQSNNTLTEVNAMPRK